MPLNGRPQHHYVTVLIDTVVADGDRLAVIPACVPPLFDPVYWRPSATSTLNSERVGHEFSPVSPSDASRAQVRIGLPLAGERFPSGLAFGSNGVARLALNRVAR
jgi:hypothetical protein